MDETIIAPPVPEDQPSDSFLSRAIGIFVSPSRTFQSIVRRPDFIAPLIVAMVGGYVLIEAMLQKIGAGRIVRHSLEMSGRAAQMTPEQLDQAVARASTITAIFMRVGAVIGIPIFVLIIAAVGLLIANLVFGGSVNFKTAFSVVCYANLVLQVAVILGLFIVFMGDPEQFNPENPVPTTVGFFLNPRETSKVVYAVASSFDIFRIWFIVLTSLGLSIATDKKVGTTAILLTFIGLWVLIVLGKAGFAAL